tara:strand:+ start:1581 stop:1964 length:384 start_codon:yes stop_codon:yes gene_type:complete
MSSPTYGDLSFQLEIMAGWINPSAEGDTSKFGLGTMFVFFDDASVGSYPIVPMDSDSGVRVRIDSLADLGLEFDLEAISGELVFETIEMGEKGRPESAQGSYSGEFAQEGSGETIELSGNFAIGLGD